MGQCGSFTLCEKWDAHQDEGFDQARKRAKAHADAEGYAVFAVSDVGQACFFNSLGEH